MLPTLYTTLVAAAATRYVLQQDGVKAEFDESGLVGLGFGEVEIEVRGDGFAIEGPNLGRLTPANTTPTVHNTTTSITYEYTTGDISYTISYSIRGEWVVKQASVGVKKMPWSVSSIDFYPNVVFGGGFTSFETASDFFRSTAGFARLSPTTSLIFTLMSPYGSYSMGSDNSTHTANVTFNVNMSLIAPPSSSATATVVSFDPMAVGYVQFSPKYKNPMFNTEVYTEETAAFKKKLDALRLGGPQHKPTTVNVGWDENDYQLDISSPADLTEYKRIIDMNSELGIDMLVVAFRDSRHSSRFNTKDGWGFEEILWLSMGEQLRNGSWTVQQGVPQDIINLVQYATSRNVTVLAYVYPSLAFEVMSEYFVTPFVGNVLDMSPLPVRDYMTKTLSSFYSASGIGGYAWDHDFRAGDPQLWYTQYQTWDSIRTELCNLDRNIIFDNRQNAHTWGPWYMMHPGYSEPLCGDENPASYGVLYPSFHTDIITANKMRSCNYFYSRSSMLAPSQIPGFIGHQTERSNGTTNPCQGPAPCFGHNQRDFDILGYRYSLLSTVGTAGLNLVWAMLPARDFEEYEYLPLADKEFIKKWFQFAKDNIECLRRTDNIATMQAPTLGKVDGTHAMYQGQGYVFLFNLNYDRVNVTLAVDESIGLSGGVLYDVTELHPQPREVGTWQHVASVTTSAQCVTVLKIVPSTGGHDVEGAGVVDGALVGFKGHTERVVFKNNVEKVNGVRCTSQRRVGGRVVVDVTFSGDYVAPAMSLEVVSSNAKWRNYSGLISPGMEQQLAQRAVDYPIQWGGTDYSATWLVPTRLPLYFYTTHPNSTVPLRVYINGTMADLEMGYTSRDVPNHRTFLGYWFNATAMLPGPHYPFEISVDLSTDPAFQGAYWENLTPEPTNVVSSC